MKIRPTSLAAASVAAALVAAAGVGTPAFAASAHRHTSHTFTVHGVVVAKSGSHVRVLTHSARINGRTVAPRVVTLTVTSKTRSHAAGVTAHTLTASDPTTPITVGSDITASGTTTGGTLTVTTATVKPVAAEAIYGLVLSVNGNLITLAGRDEARGDGEQGNGDHGNRDRTNILDLSAAKISGSATAVSAIKAGQFIVALGENTDTVMAVADAAVFDAAPQVLIGKVASADSAAGTFTVAVRDHRHDGSGDTNGGGNGGGDNHDNAVAAHHDGGGDGNNGDAGAAVTVTTAGADIVINGNAQSGASSTFPSVGDHVLVLAPETSPAGTPGTPPSASLTIAATLVYDFNSGDRGPVGQNGDDNGSNNSGDHGDGGND